MAQRRVWREALQRALRKAIAQPPLASAGAVGAEGAVAAGEFRSAGRTLADLLLSAGQGPSGLRSKHLSSAAWLFTAGSAAAALSMSTVSAGSFFSVESSPVDESEAASTSSEGVATEKKLRVVFVLGGPGSGKGTQCTKIVDEFGFTHLSAGDLLRAEIKSGSEYGTMIQTMIKEGKIVPAEVTVNLLKKAMKDSGNDKFLIDGFPRNDENRECFERETGIEPEFILFFDCPEEVMEARLLGRNQGRIDDNIETIRKRFKVFVEQSIPVVEHYEKRGKVNKVDATKTPDEVFKTLSPFFVRFIQD